ncbi:MAG: DegT/DnrJ/EryC1/StrS family aminotransferase [Gemmataceae bacterium]
MSIRLRPPIPLPSDQDITGRTFGDEEIAAVTLVLKSGTLTSTKGTWAKSFATDFAAKIGSKYASACSSGTMALHVAFAALNPEPGDEFITTAITDMGALAPIIYQGAIPVFADVDPRTCNVTPESVEAAISPKTKAIVVTHLFGNPCDMTGILEVARKHNLPVIEDCAQSFLATWEGRYTGTLGTIGCFSLQQGKHITCGEGGLVVTDDPALARRMELFINKAWGYGDPKPDHYFLALNGRMSELCGAVASAQLGKLDGVVESRVKSAAQLTSQLQGIPGIETPWSDPRAVHTYWKYCLRIDSNLIAGGAPGIAKPLKERGIASAPRYIQKPAFQCEVIRDHKTFGQSKWPFTLARPEAIDYRPERFPGTFAALDQILVLPWTEKYETQHLDYLAASVRECAELLKK